jgi:RNA polymerase sigma-70 factor (ECF subfamily)
MRKKRDFSQSGNVKYDRDWKEDPGGFLEALRTCDNKAHERLYREYGREIFGYVRSWFPFDRTICEDVQQNVFVTAYLKAGGLREIQGLKSWLYSIARRKCLDEKRRYKRELRKKDEFRFFGRIEDPDPVVRKLEEKEIFSMLHCEVVALPDKFRELFVMSEFQGLKYREIAEITGLSEPLVKKRMVGAVALLTRNLEKKGMKALLKAHP